MSEHLSNCNGGEEFEFHDGPDRCPACDAEVRAVLRHEGVNLDLIAAQNEAERNQRIEDEVADGLYRSHKEG